MVESSDSHRLVVLKVNISALSGALQRPQTLCYTMLKRIIVIDMAYIVIIMYLLYVHNDGFVVVVEAM